MKQDQKQEPKSDQVHGNILLFYLFDIGGEIDLEKVKNKGLVNNTNSYQSPFFKYYHVPLSFQMKKKQQKSSKKAAIFEEQDSYSLFNKIYEFGVISFCYKIPFTDSFEILKSKIIDIKKQFDEKSKNDAKSVFEDIYSVIEKPRFCNIKNDYFVIQVNPVKELVSLDIFKKQYGPKIASLLRLETLTLSNYQKDEILSSVTGYYGQDLIIIDTDAAFIYDDEYFEVLEFIESANLEKLELSYFDRILDQKLRYYYVQESYKIPLAAYIPFLGTRMDLPASRLTKLRVDISVVTERLRNCIKIAGDAYYSKLYSMLVKKLLLKEWRNSIDKKLDIFKDLYTVYQDRLDTIHEEILTLVIIILIALEAFIAMR
jgi:hypothetical protein